MADSSITINRSYVDNTSVKDFAVNTLIPEFFSDIDASQRTVGALGFTTEQLSNISEDAFNTGSVYLRETYPNRAETNESIYSHAAIFQLDEVFATAASCRFVLVMEQSAIIENMQDSYDKDTGIYYFYIDKDTTIYVEDIPYTLDYDIEMRIIKKTTDDGYEYIFSASYMMDGYTNSISGITDSYVPVRVSADGYVATIFTAHQCTRDIQYESITTNSNINYPIIDVEYDGKLAGFDILYKSADDTDYTTQLTTLIEYSQPIKTPFCFYRLEDEGTLRITFNARDGYFSPDYDSELKIILYLTEGEDGNFDSYSGDAITVIPNDDNYSYSDSYIVTAATTSASTGGTEQGSVLDLQSQAVVGYRTANALSTENDLQEYFDSYEFSYGNGELKFIRRRDDVYERIWAAYLVIRNSDYIYKTNCLNLFLNLSDMKNPEETVYMIDPGTLFTANDTSGYANFFRDEEKNAQYYADYLEAVKNDEIPYITDNVDESYIPAYLDRPASFAEYKNRKGLDDKLSIFDFEDIDALDVYNDPSNGKFLFINPFLIRFKKSPNLVSMYMTYINETSVVDFTDQNDDSFVQFILYQMTLQRSFTKEKKYTITTKINPSVTINSAYPVINGVYDTDTKTVTYTNLGDKYDVKNNDLRVIMTVRNSTGTVCYTELYPTDYDYDTGIFTFTGELMTDDHITSESKLRLLPNTVYRTDDGDYYQVTDDDATIYVHYDSDGNVLEENIPVDDVTELTKEGKVTKWTQCNNMGASSDILIPMEDVTCKIYTLYRRVYSENESELVITTDEQGNNIFTEYDSSLSNYIWTNEYSTGSDTVNFMKPLNSVRSNLEFADYTSAKEVTADDGTTSTEFAYDIMDMTMYSLPFVKYDVMDSDDKISYFMNTFINRYEAMIDVISTKLRNATNLDIKFYNTYGHSKYYTIGEDNEIINTVNLKLSFDMWFVSGTDLLVAVPEVKAYIKTLVETLGKDKINNLFISNLMRKVEQNYAYVEHIRFNSINEYPSTYQAVKTIVTDLDDLSVDDRRVYVPEMLVVDIEDITINEYFAD